MNPIKWLTNKLGGTTTLTGGSSANPPGKGKSSYEYEHSTPNLTHFFEAVRKAYPDKENFEQNSGNIDEILDILLGLRSEGHFDSEISAHQLCNIYTALKGLGYKSYFDEGYDHEHPVHGLTKEAVDEYVIESLKNPEYTPDKYNQEDLAVAAMGKVMAEIATPEKTTPNKFARYLRTYKQFEISKKCLSRPSPEQQIPLD